MGHDGRSGANHGPRSSCCKARAVQKEGRIGGNMSEGRHWMDRNLTKVGLIMFAVGIFLLALGTIGVFVELLTGSPQWQFGPGPWGYLKGILYVARFNYGLGTLLAPIGAAFYCLGRFLEVGLVTIVGFERTPPSE